MALKIGILSLQVAVEPHAEKLRSLGAEPVYVRAPEDLKGLHGIILPGGESTTMLHLLKLNQLWSPLQNFVREYPAWGVCAGAILLAKKVTGRSQDQISLEAMDIEVERNAFGRQIDSFIANLEGGVNNLPSVEGVFIRAPRIRSLFGETQILYRWENEPVMVESGRLMASTFHPELSKGATLHEYFLRKCEESHHG